MNDEQVKELSAHLLKNAFMLASLVEALLASRALRPQQAAALLDMIPAAQAPRLRTRLRVRSMRALIYRPRRGQKGRKR